jgi:hypothetical protein
MALMFIPKPSGFRNCGERLSGYYKKAPRLARSDRLSQFDAIPASTFDTLSLGTMCRASMTREWNDTCWLRRHASLHIVSISPLLRAGFRRSPIRAMFPTNTEWKFGRDR